MIEQQKKNFDTNTQQFTTVTNAKSNLQKFRFELNIIIKDTTNSINSKTKMNQQYLFQI